MEQISRDSTWSGIMAQNPVEQKPERWQCGKLIHPHSKPRLIWDVSIMIILLFQVFQIPISITYVEDELNDWWIVIFCICDAVFLSDIILNFNTGFYDKKYRVIIMNRSMVVKHYLQTWFIIDLISSIPFDYVYFGLSQNNDAWKAARSVRFLKLTKILSLFRLLRISRLMRYIWKFEEILKVSTAELKIVVVMLMMVITLHWDACLQYLVPTYNNVTPSLLGQKIADGMNTTILEQYTWSVLAAMSQMSSAGFGYVPYMVGTLSEAWLITISMALGGSLLAILCSALATHLMTVGNSERLYEEKIQEVHEYMRFMRLPLTLRCKVVSYFERRHRGSFWDTTAILGDLNSHIREIVSLHAHHWILKSLKVLRGLPDAALRNLATKLKQEVFLAHQLIVTPLTGVSIFFVESGEVQVRSSDGQTVMVLKGGERFPGNPGENKYTYVAKTSCYLFYVKVEDIVEVFGEGPETNKLLDWLMAERFLDSRVVAVNPDLCILPSTETAATVDPLPHTILS